MNYNLVAYTVYGFLMVTIIVRIGLICYRHGNIFVAHLLPSQLEVSQQVNKVLLTGYYLINIGYCIYIISTWNTIKNWSELISQVSEHLGQITLIICALHYINIIGISIFFNKQNNYKHF